MKTGCSQMRADRNSLSVASVELDEPAVALLALRPCALASSAKKTAPALGMGVLDPRRW